MRITRPSVALLALGLASCSSTVKLPDLAGLYNEAAQRHEPWRNPVIVIPGIMGSRLVDRSTGSVAWGAFSGDFADPNEAEGARSIALPMEVGTPLAELRDSVESDGALDRVRLRVFGLPYVHAAYTYILGSLGVGGYRDQALGDSGAIDYGTDHYTCFQFHYDWRRDLTENAARFAEFIELRRSAVMRGNRERYGNEDDVKFDVVAHSMGGLILRYYLRYGGAELPADGTLPELTWSAADAIDRALFIGTPNAGSLDALHDLVDGAKLGPFIPVYPQAVLGTMPAVYQLLPRARHRALVDARDPESHLDPYDPELWVTMRWGLADPDQDDVLARLLPKIGAAERRRVAIDHLGKCLDRARRVSAALDVPAERPDGLDLYLFCGDAEPTRAVAGANPLDGRFLFTDHLGMTRDPAFTDNALFILLEDPREGFEAGHVEVKS